MANQMKVDTVNGERGYINISDHGLIGNMRTAALVSIDGSIESYCYPNFDSPSVFARILDKDKGGHFSITPSIPFNAKQSYLPSSNVLSTKFLSDEGVVNVTDFMPRRSDNSASKAPLFWLIRRVEVIRGKMPMRVECAPAFNYARDEHQSSIVIDDSVPDSYTPLPTSPISPADSSASSGNGEDVVAIPNPNPNSPNKLTLAIPKVSGTTGAGKEAKGPAHTKAVFTSPALTLDLRYVTAAELENVDAPKISLKSLDLGEKGHKGLGVYTELEMVEGQVVTFVLRSPPVKAASSLTQPTRKQADQLGVSFEDLVKGASKLRGKDDPILTPTLMAGLLKDTNKFWQSWIRKSTYTGSWKESVHRSALALKLLIFEPTGAIVASPTFSLPEYIGGTRNWDYRATWIRDSSFTLYALIRLGFTQEAHAFMDFVFHSLEDRNPDGSLQIMYTIHGGKEFPEIELTHLDGHKGSKPVRIGNGAIDHVQLDIYGELMDCIYLGQKYGKPISYDLWCSIRELVDYVVSNCHRADLSIWEVRNKERHFTYSKVMMWVAIDRGLRLADKRQLPLLQRDKWLRARDQLYEEIMAKAYNKKLGFFAQSYEDLDVLDSAVLIMPLVFFSTPSDNRFISTLKQILKSRERGGLTSNNLVYRYDVRKSDDGVGGEEGTFCLCTLWCVEALTRAGQYDPELLEKAVSMFEDFLQYGNHVHLFSEEISEAGEGLGNAVQGFTHVTLISAAYNLSRVLKGAKPY